jgi:hypothetical protein
VYKMDELNKLIALAKDGDKDAMFKLANQYVEASDDGEDSDMMDEAFHWLNEAAEGGHLEAQYTLGSIGSRNEDYDEAFKWFTRAANAGHRDSKTALAVCYGAGQGTEVNTDEAVKWLTQAASEGCSDAKFRLGALYLQGQEVEEDATRGMAYLRDAAAMGHEEAKEGLRLLEEEATSGGNTTSGGGISMPSFLDVDPDLRADRIKIIVGGVLGLVLSLVVASGIVLPITYVFIGIFANIFAIGRKLVFEFRIGREAKTGFKWGLTFLAFYLLKDLVIYGVAGIFFAVYRFKKGIPEY